MDRPDAALIVEEFAHNARMAVTACRMGGLLLAKDTSAAARTRLVPDMERILDEHNRLWLARNRPGGLADSRRLFEVRLAECRQPGDQAVGLPR